METGCPTISPASASGPKNAVAEVFFVGRKSFLRAECFGAMNPQWPDRGGLALAGGEH
jgi:hypothetical protein